MSIENRIGFGCVALTIMPSLNSALSVLNNVYENGIAFFDTAPIYGKGYSEIILGKFLKNKKREDITITTKFGLGEMNSPSLPSLLALPLNYLKKKIKTKGNASVNKLQEFKKVNYRSISKNQVEFDFNNSLKRLQTDYIDNYLLHEATPHFLTEEANHFLFDMKAKGLIKKLGMGVCHQNLVSIPKEEIVKWDILQYENSLQINSDSIYSSNPTKLHIHHSIFKDFNKNTFPTIAENQKGGYLIANHLMKFPESKILFSSTNSINIVNNLKFASNFYCK